MNATCYSFSLWKLSTIKTILVKLINSEIMSTKNIARNMAGLVSDKSCVFEQTLYSLLSLQTTIYMYVQQLPVITSWPGDMSNWVKGIADRGDRRQSRSLNRETKTKWETVHCMSYSCLMTNLQNELEGSLLS